MSEQDSPFSQDPFIPPLGDPISGGQVGCRGAERRPPNTLIVVVLDESGSMESKVDDDRRDALNELG